MRRLLIAATLAAPLATWAAANAVPNLSPRDLAMCGALVAAQDSAGAVFANPAALSALSPGLHLSLAASMVNNGSKWTDPTTGETSSMRFNPAWPPALFAAWSDRYQGRGWGVGAGMTVPWGGNVLWPLGWPGRFRIMGVDQRTYAFFFNGGVEIIPQLRIGGGFNYYRTTERLKQGTNFLGTESWAELSDAGGAPSWQVSAEFTPFADVPLKLGVDYKHQAVQTLKGRAHFENPPPALAPETLDQDVSHRYTVPNSMHVGLAYQASKRLLLAAAVSMDRFEVYKEDRFVGSAGTTIVVPRDLSNAYTYRLGAEYDLNERWKLRAGVERDVGVTPTDRLSPSLPDASSWNGSVGAAFALRPNLSLEGTYFYAHMDRIQSTGTEPLPGIYDIYAHIVSVGLNWHMAAGSR